MIRIILTSIWLLVALAGAANAGPVFFAALSAGASVGSAFAATALGSFLTTTLVGRLLTSVALTALSQALQSKPKIPVAGIKTSSTAGGGVNPLAFIIGRYATAGVAACPAMSHGNVGQTPNAYLTYVIELSDIPGVTLNRLMIDGEYVTLGPTPHPDYGLPVEGRLAGYAWCKTYDGTQVAADPMLLDKYGSYPDRPWTADMIGTGLVYAIVTFRYNRELFNSLPEVRFEVDGIPLYDPREDDTVGGSGTQRWSTPSTWAQTDNPMVMAYNILRGITLPDGSVWGGGSEAADLPLSEWFAAMNACDVAEPIAAGGTEPRYRAGLEITVDDEPAAVLDELFKACSAQIADVGGVWKPRVGGVGLPVYFFDDDGVIVSSPQDFDPFHGLDQTYNGVSATYPEPDSSWESKEAPPRYSATYEADDGDRRLIANLTLGAAPYPLQVQRLMRAYIEDERRFRRHTFALPPAAAIVEPLDAAGWTSARNGYSSKVFEVAEISDNLMTLVQTVSIRERDAADYIWSSSYELPSSPPPTVVVQPAAQAVPSFTVTGIALDDASLTARRPALLLSWDGSGQDDVTALEYEVRRLGGAQVMPGVTTNVAAGKQIVSGGILPETTYEARARFVVNRAVTWTAWTAATTPAAYITLDDFEDFTQLFTDAGLTVPAIVGALPGSGGPPDLVYLTTDQKIYRWNGVSWTAEVPTTDLTGRVAQSQLVIADTANLIEDPGFELLGSGTHVSWGVGQVALNGFGLTAFQGVNVRTGDYSIGRVYDTTGSYALWNSAVIEVAAGDTLRVSCWLKKASAGSTCLTAGMRVQWYDRDGVALAASNVVIPNASITTSYQQVSGIVTAPTGAVSAKVGVFIENQTAGTFHWDDTYCYRANAGELIVDGTIYGNHIAANTITGGLIAASGIITQIAQITDGIITNAKIANATIQGAKIANLAVDTIKIADHSVTALETSFTAAETSNISATSGLVVIQTLVIDKARSDPLPIWASWFQNSPVGAGTMYAEIVVGSTIIGWAYWDSPFIADQRGYQVAIDESTATGSRTYQLRAKVVSGNLEFTMKSRVLTGLKTLK